MYHYLYLITFNDNMQYVGAHSSKNKPEDDVSYLGSGADLPERNYLTCKKEILNTFTTRNELLEAEMLYILEHNCVASEQYYNKRLKSTFDKHGQTKAANINISITADKLKGRSKHTHQYLVDGGLKKSFYKGENRTPLQKKWSENSRGVSQGENPLKGHSSTTNPAFVPWYFIDPSGKYTEVFDKTKLEYAEMLGAPKKSIATRCIKANEHIVVKKGFLKGYTFGNLDTKPTDTE